LVHLQSASVHRLIMSSCIVCV